MIVPLGLGSRLPRFPWLSAGLSLALVLWHLMGGQGAGEKELSHIYARFDLPEITQSLFSEFCTGRGGRGEDCSRLAPLSARRYAEDSDSDLLGQLQDFAKLDKKIRYADILSDFLASESGKALALGSLPSYEHYRQAKSAAEGEIAAWARGHRILTSASLSVAALMKAQFAHAGYWHLLTNILFLLFFGAYVEQRMNKAAVLATYLLGGLLGLAVEARYFLPPASLLVGASANVAALMGLFFVLFYRFRMRLFVFAGVIGKSFYAPVALVFPALYIVFEVIGALEENSPVAHSAHLAGMAVGIAAGWLTLKLQPLAWPFVYPFEKEAFQRVEAQGDLPTKVAEASRILSYNLENNVVREHVIRVLVNFSRSHAVIDEKSLDFMAEHLQSWAAVTIRRGQMPAVASLFMQIPVHLPMTRILGNLGQENVLKIGDALLDRGALIPALRVYDFYLCRNPRSAKNPALRRTLSEIVQHLPETRACFEELRSLLRANDETRLTPLLIDKYEYLGRITTEKNDGRDSKEAA